MFGIDSQEPIPYELLHTYEGWDGYVAHLWYCLMYFMGLKCDDTVVEVGPGSSLKMAYALQKLRFQGDLYLIDPAQDTLIDTIKHYQRLLPLAKVVHLNCPMSQARADLPLYIDFLLAHHVLDDMIVSGVLTKNQPHQRLFSWTRQDKLEVDETFKKHWEALVSSPLQLKRIKTEIYEAWCEALTMWNPRVWIMSQYPSLVLEQAGLHALNQTAFSLFKKIKKSHTATAVSARHIQRILNGNKHYQLASIGKEVLNQAYWMIGERSC